MSDKSLYLEIVTPSKIAFSGNVTSVTVPGELGSFQILFNHAPIISSLAIGELKIKTENDEIIRYAVDGGFVMVYKNRVTVVSDSLLHSNEIDTKETEKNLLRLKEEIIEKRKKGDVELIEKQIAQLENRLRVASKT